MKTAYLVKELKHNQDKPAITVMLNKEFGKEIRIAFNKAHVMKEHQTSYPNVVEVFDGVIVFEVYDEMHTIKRGDLLTLEGGVPHELTALEDSIVRLSLNKSDSTKRVRKVVENSAHKQ